MRQWPGLREDQTNVGGEGLSAATGISYYVEGELRRRPGLTYLADYGFISMCGFRSVLTGSWVTGVIDIGLPVAYNLGTSTATNLPAPSGSYNIEARPYVAPLGPRVYWTNDFERMAVWNAVDSALRDAGIPAPAAAIGSPSTAGGNCTAGIHLIRYRFIDSKSPAGGYRSNPSPPLTYTVAAGNEQLTFDIGTSGTDIIRSTDSKVDTIQVEMTLVDGTTYYVATTCLNTASTVVVSISDSSLAVQEDVAATWGGFGHEQPPLGSCIFECRGHAFLCGATKRTRTVGVTLNSTSVTGTNFSTLWAGRLIRIGTDTAAYEISSATSTVITLTSPYLGSTNAAVTATIYSKNPNRAYWSRQYLFESWKPATQARDVLAGFGDSVVGGCDFQGDAWFFGTRSMGRLVFADDPANGEVNPVPGYHGLWSSHCLMPLDGVLYGWGPNGAWMISGGAPRWISRAIDTAIADLIDVTESDQFFAAYDPVEKVIRWHFVATGDSEPKYTMTYELTGQRWSIDQYRTPITCATTVADPNGRVRLVVSDGTNENLYYHSGTTDGVPSPGNGVYTVAAVGSTTSVIVVNESLPETGTEHLYSLVLYRPATGEESIIDDNDSSTITIDVPFATTPSPAEEMYVGAIPCSITTDWWIDRDLGDKKRPHLHLLFNPSATGSVRVKVYRDFQTSPHTWTQVDGDRWPDGVTMVDGRNYLEVALGGGASVTDGFVSLPMPSDWGRAWRAELIVLSPAGSPKILDVRFAVTAGRDQGTETDE